MKHISLLLLPAVLLLAACGGGKSDADKLADLKKKRAEMDAQIRQLEGAQPDTARKAATVTAVPVQRASFTAFVDVQANITGDENVLATSQAPGTVKSVNVRPGQQVSRGQVLATLDAAALEQQIAAQDVQVGLARTVYQKQQRLWAQQIGSELQLIQAKSNYEGAVKMRDALVAQRNMYRVVAPISGTVDEVNLKVGDQASMGGIRIVSFDKLKAEANLGENYIGKVQVGNPVTLLLPDLGDSIRARLDFVANSVDAVSRSFLVQVRLGANGRLRPNMSARLRIANYSNGSALTVPASVIQNTAGGTMLYIARTSDSTARSMKVQTGRISNGQVEILSGLKEGDLVITEGYQNLDEGSKIKVQ